MWIRYTFRVEQSFRDLPRDKTSNIHRSNYDYDYSDPLSGYIEYTL